MNNTFYVLYLTESKCNVIEAVWKIQTISQLGTDKRILINADISGTLNILKQAALNAFMADGVEGVGYTCIKILQLIIPFEIKWQCIFHFI